MEARTIVYLITRRMRRATVLLVKFLATALVLAALCDLAMIALHVCTVSGRDLPTLIADTAYADWNPTGDLGHYLMIIPIAVVCFLVTFSFIGLITSRPLAFSVVYLITIEQILSNLPIRARMFSLSHQLRVPLAGMMPRVTALFELEPEVREELYSQGATALPTLLAVVFLGLVLSAVLVTVRELVPAKVSRD